MNLELMALRWLLYERRCEIAICERSPRSLHCGEPDALGITKSRYMIEVEIKRSLSDFRADRRKQSRNPCFREAWKDKLPRQFYYLVLAELATRVELILPPWAGLISGPAGGPKREDHELRVVRNAPVNRDSERLTVRECCRIVRMVANFSISTMESYQASIARFRAGEWQWPQPDFEI